MKQFIRDMSYCNFVLISKFNTKVNVVYVSPNRGLYFRSSRAIATTYINDTDILPTVHLDENI